MRLLGETTPFAKDLLDSFTFLIVPMVNPDGVIHGNSRTNLLGYDINRNWSSHSPIRVG